MNNEKALWAVSYGEYSDYGVLAIMATKELAEEYAALHEDWYIEDFEFLDSVPEHVQVLHIRSYFGGKYDNEALERVTNELATDRNPACEHHIWFYDNSHSACVSVRGTDFDRVRKVYSEQRAQVLADPRINMREPLPYPPSHMLQ